MQPPYTYSIDVRFADLDAYNHVNNAVFFTYLETARTRVFSDQLIGFMDLGLFFVVAKAQCEFKKPIRLEDSPVTVEFWIHSLGRTRFTIKYRLLGPEGQLFALAETVMVTLDAKKGVPTAIPDALREKIENF